VSSDEVTHIRNAFMQNVHVRFLKESFSIMNPMENASCAGRESRRQQ